MPKQIKVIFVGDSEVGKTSVLTQGCSEDPFISKIESTNMVDLYFKKVKIKENQITISVINIISKKLNFKKPKNNNY